ncbi:MULTISPECIES: quinone oxidoreductase family protein [Amycolatopsis]|uniref:NADPH:quinone reductase n=2 Tax=Amycolatopsis TaxID=1813 RepID=A0A1I3WKM5_9PSEU|nr:NADP-dependent oxidoreductase [Amycolatopsis sacchari]SFK08035.1 NADPH:quinone reductase [Amycolatopsis sacchari]
MKALVAREYGPLDQLELTEVPRPVPGQGQVLVRTEAAAVNPVDLVLVTGGMRDALPVSHPFVPGVDVSGVVEAVGSGVDRFAVGDPVIAWTGVPSGAFAEYALVRADDSAVVRPAALDARRAAALPTGALTASALLDEAKPRAGSTLLVVGAAGGLGSYAVQLAKRAGATVFATGREDDLDYLTRLGADGVLDYRGENVAERVREWVPGGVDAVIDVALAGPDLATSAAAARPGGVLVSPRGGPAEFDCGVTAVYTGTTTPSGRLAELARAAAAHELHIEISAQYPFAEARQALLDFAGQHVRGKVVITF